MRERQFLQQQQQQAQSRQQQQLQASHGQGGPNVVNGML